VWVFTATLLQLARQPGVPSIDTVWAEDGGVFLTDALNQGFVHTLLSSYAGYLHVVPRVVAWATALLPLHAAAFFMTAVAAAIVALLSLYIYWAARGVIRSRWGRCMLAGILVLLPAAGYETNATVCNLHWYLMFATVWALLAPWQTRREVTVHAAVAGAAMFSDPLTALLLPLAMVRVWRNRAPITWAVTGTLLVGMVVQGVATKMGPQPASLGTNLADLPSIYALRVAGSFTVGDRLLTPLYTHAGLPFAYACAAGTLVVAGALAWVVRDRRTRLLALALLGYSAIFLFVPLGLRGTEDFLEQSGFSLNGSRYTVVPILLLYALFVLLIDRTPRPALFRVPRQSLMVAFTALTAVLVLTNYSDFSARTLGPSWSASLAAARQRCIEYNGRPPDTLSPENFAETVTPHAGQAVIPVAPNDPAPPFSVIVDCSRLS
jgi:hypothetical protein